MSKLSPFGDDNLIACIGSIHHFLLSFLAFGSGSYVNILPFSYSHCLLTIEMKENLMECKESIDLFKRHVGSRSGRRPVLPCLTGWVEFFRIEFGFLSLGRIFSGWVEFWVKNHGSNPAGELLWIKNYSPYPLVALVGSGRVFSVGLDWSGRVTHN